MEIKHIFIAVDGKEFDSEYACIEYENKLEKQKLDGIIMYDSYRNITTDHYKAFYVVIKNINSFNYFNSLNIKNNIDIIDINDIKTFPAKMYWNTDTECWSNIEDIIALFKYVKNIFELEDI